MAVIEIAVDSTESALASQQGGAQRIELCCALGEGGVTPSLGLVRSVRSSCSLSLFTIIRPRGGDFLYTDHEFMTMKEDIRIMAQEGVDGVVLGILTQDGSVDVDRTRTLVEAAGSMDVTFHRAIDVSKDVEASLEQVIAAGVKRVLTSGGYASAWEGRERLKRMIHQAGKRATIMAGGGVRASNVQELMTSTSVRELHSSLRRMVASPMRYKTVRLNLGGPGADDFERNLVSAEEVRGLVTATEQAESVTKAENQSGRTPLLR